MNEKECAISDAWDLIKYYFICHDDNIRNEKKKK